MQGLPLFVGRRNSFFRLLVIAIPVVLLLTVLSQNVFAQNTFVITEGDQVIVHKSYTTDPAEALAEAGIEVDPDEYRAYLCKNNTYDIRVVRDDTVVVMNCGEKMYVAVEENTVGELLERIGVPACEGYEISCALDTELEDGMTIVVECLQTREVEESADEMVINNGVAVLPNGEVLNCYELGDY